MAELLLQLHWHQINQGHVSFTPSERMQREKKYRINVPVLFESVGTKRKTKERKNKTKHQRCESGVGVTPVWDAMRCGVLSCVCAKCEMRGHSLRTKTRTHCVTSVIKTTVNRTDAMVSHVLVQMSLYYILYIYNTVCI